MAEILGSYLQVNMDDETEILTYTSNNMTNEVKMRKLYMSNMASRTSKRSDHC